MKKLLMILLVILAVFTAFFLIRYDSLERKIIIGNIGYSSDINFDGVSVDKSDHIIEITFKNSKGNDHLFDTINGIYRKCSQIIANELKYQNYDMEFIIKDAGKVVFDMSENSIYCARNHNKLLISVADISREYPDIEYLSLDDIYVNENERSIDIKSSLSDNEVYADYCNTDNYKSFIQLKYISFCVKPDKEVLDYLEERFPDCVIEFRYSD